MYQSILFSLVMALTCSSLFAQQPGQQSPELDAPVLDSPELEAPKSAETGETKPSETSPAETTPAETAKSAKQNEGQEAAKTGLEKVAPDVQVAKLEGLTPLSDKFGLWIDTKRKWVVADGKVCLNRGVLEMFACPRGTKEHESVISVNCKAQYIHAALLAVEAKPGTPVQFDPEYKPATGQIIDIYILWVDKDGKKQSVRAQEWIRNTKTKKEMKHSFVFAGSSFWEEEIDGERLRHYQADAGDLICVSNFPSATLDLPIKSSKENSSLLYEAYPDRIPPRGTAIRLVLIPRKAKEKTDKNVESGKAGPRAE